MEVFTGQMLSALLLNFELFPCSANSSFKTWQILNFTSWLKGEIVFI